MWAADKLIYQGRENFIKAYQGSELVWEKSTASDFFRVTSLENNNVIYYRADATTYGNIRRSTLLYSINGGEWINVEKTYDTTDEVYVFEINATLNTGDYIMMKGLATALSGSNFDYFKTSKTVNLSGHLCSLLYDANYDSHEDEEIVVAELFWGQTSNNRVRMVDASNLILPTNAIYSGTFRGVSRVSPFSNCATLKYAPAIRNKVLKMYDNWYLFYNCTSLEKVVCYADTIEQQTSDEQIYYGTQSWMKNVKATGTFYKLGNATYTTGDSGIPAGWTIKTELD